MVLEISNSVPRSTVSHRCPSRPLLVGVGRNVRLLDSLGVIRCHGASIIRSSSRYFEYFYIPLPPSPPSAHGPFPLRFVLHRHAGSLAQSPSPMHLTRLLCPCHFCLSRLWRKSTIRLPWKAFAISLDKMRRSSCFTHHRLHRVTMASLPNALTIYPRIPHI
jgi:hypothetical protein